MAKASPPTTKTKKRTLEDIESQEQNMAGMSICGDEQSDDPIPPIKKLSKLRLEAIFHPKFENEALNNNIIRNKMKEKVQSGSGYIEVSLKHSGSLVLWSGGASRFYSKNSMDNIFTNVAEILLRQHFIRAWWNNNDNDDNNNNNNNNDDFEFYYRKCSDYIEQHRLTCAFEVVTNMLGDHGDVPLRDFIVLTAVADRNQERFYSTTELIQFAQQFRLPHNDAWIFTNTNNVNQLFTFYDTCREEGLAHDTIKALNHASNARVCSMYPHEDFQGNILEGIVIRYVPNQTKQTDQINDTTKNNPQELMHELAATSQQILKQVPVNLPEAHILVQKKKDSHYLSSVATINLRQLFQETSGGIPYDEKFSGAVSSILNNQSEQDRGHRRTLHKPKGRSKFDLPKVTKHLIDSDDAETKRIANLLQTVDSLNSKVVYSIIQEETKQGKSKVGRWLCTLHVLHDATFRKFNNKKNSTTMSLFRGCFLELADEDSNSVVNEKDEMNDNNDVAMFDNSDKVNDEESLMLKMKFVPYMVRTFICRNNLKLLKNDGPESFLIITKNYLKTWGVSVECKKKWIPFFAGWAQFAYPILNEEETISDIQTPLADTSYLAYLEYYTKLYESGQVAISDPTLSSSFRGLVLVVGQTTERAKIAAEYIATRLGTNNNVTVIDGEKALKNETRWGVVCHMGVEIGSRKIRTVLKEAMDYTTIVLFGLSEEDIDAYAPLNERKKITGISRGWRGMQCGHLFEIKEKFIRKNTKDMADGEGEDDDDDDDMEDQDVEAFNIQKDIDKILEIAQKGPKGTEESDNDRAGLLVFFPGIPGCGKSTIVSKESIEQLQSKLAARKEEKSNQDINDKETPEYQQKQQQIDLFIGDAAENKDKFWKLVRKHRKNNQSCICIADKNAPPTMWKPIGDICAATGGVPVAVIPQGSAVYQTTIINNESKQQSSNEDSSSSSSKFTTSRSKHVFPFSLHFLAVCMARVLERENHLGKLDSSCDHACMVVIYFFTFYHDIAGDEFKDSVKRKLGYGGAPEIPDPIEVPFFKFSALPPLPKDLSDVLIEAIKLQAGPDGYKSKQVKNRDMESRLRSAIETHRDTILQMTVSEKETREAALQQLANRIEQLDNVQLDSKDTFAKLASIDVSLDSIRDTVMASSDPNVMKIQEIALQQQQQQTDCTDEARMYISKTHITMAHFSQLSQSQMRSTFGDLVGLDVEIQVKGLLWNDQAAALAVQIAETTMGGLCVPRPLNEFHHITLWHLKKGAASDSNHLPKWVSEGTAQQIEFQQPLILKGTISFWTNDNQTM